MRIRYKLLILFIIVGIAAAVIMNLGLFEDEVPKEVRDSINNLAGDSFGIERIDVDDDLYKIWIEFKFVPGSSNAARVYTDSVCKDTREILSENGISSNIVVHGIRKIIHSRLVEYGSTYYHKSTGEYIFIKPDKS
ncbi:MAG: hypothetical protein R6U89_07465 [Dehalococcoidia bacterium]